MKGEVKEKRKVIMLFLGILLVIGIVLGVSYAYIKYESRQEELNIVGTECLSLSLVDESEAITVAEAYPIKEEEGKKTKPYTFTVKNNCNTLIDYSVNLEALEHELRMNSKYVAVFIDEEEIKTLSEYKETEHLYVGVEGHVLLTSFLEPQASESHTLRLWIDEEADNGSQNKTFLSKVVIEGTPNEVIAERANIVVENKNYEGEVINDINLTGGYAYESIASYLCEGEKENCYFKVSEEVEILGTVLESCGSEEEPDACTKVEEPISITPNTWYKIKSNIKLKPKEETKEQIEIIGNTCVGNECSEKETFVMAIQDKNVPIITLGEISSNYQGASIPFEASDLESGIGSIRCKYGLSEENLELEGIIENNSCKLSNFQIDSTYYYSLEVSDKVGNEKRVTGSISSKEVVTAPIISGGSKEYAKERTITIATEGSADTGVNHYEYYISKTKETPSSEVVISGEGESVTLNEEGTWYVYFRSVSNQGNRSSWSGYEEVNIFYKASSVSYTNRNEPSVGNVQEMIDIIKEKWIG